jgi:hypothetical protein
MGTLVVESLNRAEHLGNESPDEKMRRIVYALV